ncbi:dihydroneopterin aldolase [Candidatus Gracilibacteria bacterium]|nr:dihydroneopterin aldolase [Candidatus Gracilibacteria bacterium]
MKFSLQNIPVFLFLGINPQEQAKKQKILVSLSWELETFLAEKSDQIEDTVDYFSIHEFLKKFPKERKFNLLETLHMQVLQTLKKEFPKLQNPVLTLQKFPFDEGSITISNDK